MKKKLNLAKLGRILKMREHNYNALNFSFLLLDFYKEMNLSENELAVILMINHLIEQGNEFITSEMLELKMSLSLKSIDSCMTNLYIKKYIEFLSKDNHPYTSIEPIKRVIYKKFEKTLFSDEEIMANEELNIRRDRVFKFFTDSFRREMSPIELSHIDDWLKNNIPEEIIVNSVKDAINSNKLSISYIDSLIQRKLKNE